MGIVQRRRARRAAARFRLPGSGAWLEVYRDVLAGSERTGIVLVDRGNRIRLWNDAATRLLGRAVPYGESIDCLVGDPALAELISPGHRRSDETAVLAEKVLQITRRPVLRKGKEIATVTAIHDDTEVQRLTAQIMAERDSTLALRARAHEADNRLHTVVSLVELGYTGKAVDFATAVLARSRQMHESIQSTVADPVLAALLMGKAICADEAGVALHVDPSTTVPETDIPSEDLVLVLGNLIDNGIDAAASMPPPRWVHVLAAVDDGLLRLQVSDSGPGLAPDSVEEAFRAGWTTKAGHVRDEAHGQGLGLALVTAATHRLGGTVGVDRWVGARFVVEVPLPDRSVAGGARHA
jgi:two-component system, CitB family, sensor kinase